MRVGLRLRVVALTGGSSTKAMVSKRLNHALASLELSLSDDQEPSALIPVSRGDVVPAMRALRWTMHWPWKMVPQAVL